MHTPKHFAENRIETLHSLIRAQPFATLVTTDDGCINADHLPMVLAPDPVSHGTLHAHVARANPVWRSLGNAMDVLVVFHGPDAYISPSWYPSKQQTGKAVPTWNYLVVHARGTARPIHDRDWLHTHVEELTRVNENGRIEPWQVDDAPADFTDKLLNAIVGIEIRITSLTGQWKLGQNRSAEDQRGMRDGLAAEGSAADSALLDWIERRG